MSDEKPFGNITVRLEREFLGRLELLEEATRLNRSEITRQSLDAAIRQFERTGKLSFPFEIADVSLADHQRVLEQCGKLSAQIQALETIQQETETRVATARTEVLRLQDSLIDERAMTMKLQKLNAELEKRLQGLTAKGSDEKRPRKRSE